MNRDASRDTIRSSSAINPYVHHSHKAVRARVHLLDAPNIPLSLTVRGSITTTTSPTYKLSLQKYHFCLDPICSKYSFIHQFQACLVSSCTLLQHFLGLNDSMSTLSSTKSSPICPVSQDAVAVRVVTHSC